MNETALGRLERVDLRNIWESEATHFTPWLAREENLALLGEAIGMDLELEALEQNVGPFRADILCKEISNDQWVLIENQLEKTDHTHLGQLLTYAAGLQAVTIVWLTKKFTEEHRAALDWLNDITDDRFNFFGLEIELWRIGNSAVAPKFNVISQPNEWSRSVSQNARNLEQSPTETQLQRQEFWGAFLVYLEEKKPFYYSQLPKLTDRSYMTFRIGKTGFEINSNLLKTQLRVEFRIKHHNHKAYFNIFKGLQHKIEQEYGQPLEWRCSPDKQVSVISITKDYGDPLDPQQWPEIMEWFCEHLTKMRHVFSKQLNLITITTSPIENDREHDEE